ncbi:MAG: YggS family pyridoxal phosphate-dependent enzyme [Anaerolineae bacterium]|nr:YggS family pyridoxal phosphate-dependent enzyme [Anaerolineae bacterium]
MELERELRGRLDAVRERVSAAARRAGREPGEIEIVAVSKGVPAGRVAALARLGVHHLGENRVEEAEAKIPAVHALLTADETRALRWYLVGHLQSRKAARALQLFDEVHSVDSVRLAARLDRLAGEEGRRLPILLEVNISGEATKYGLSAGAWPRDREQAESLYAQVEAILGLRHLAVQGLMTVAPLVPDPEAVRPVFRRLRDLRDVLARRWPGHAWPVLSMGMSDDYEVAVEEGATMIRLGRALFGPRL